MATSVLERGHSPATTRAGFYIPALDGIRGIAFLLVFVAHSGFEHLVPGGLGVTIFFFLSGYLITTLLRIEAERSGAISLSQFYFRRARRILPPMYITLAVAYGLAYLGLVGRGSGSGALSVLFYYFNYRDLITPTLLPSGLGVTWSLMIEEHFYFVFPFLYLFLLRYSRKAQASILAGICLLPLAWRFVLALMLHTSLTTLPRWTYSATDARFDALLWGCVLAIGINPWFSDEARP